MTEALDLHRFELADISLPRSLALAVHAQLGKIAPPVPVDNIARALDIAEIRTDIFDGFEGMLLTDQCRSQGAILASTRHGQRRARFTIAHELGHFLMEQHVLSAEDGFRCRAQDMRETREGRRHQKQESQANEFAIGLLAPFRMVDLFLSKDPDLRDGQRLREGLDVSLEACVRRMIDRRQEPLAAVWSKNGQVRYSTRNGGFPFVHLEPGDRLPQISAAFRAVGNNSQGFTAFTEIHAAAWINRTDIDLFEQTRVGADGHAVTLLWADAPEPDETD
ncbi:protein of unknown function [Roseovarius azorensis]|uniref:IrrE N-terminal-like domain-containing protein n=1 Tax=Roseovarius azorensis TaxID=1287727 RepID=A0A1H7WFI8_9RHOB|nr:ImmA/IrrE family metallo-endopeptidase [Roseovarius azorensis]SEM20114.1 protein of unknown function [Roseovarius azorensis]